MSEVQIDIVVDEGVELPEDASAWVRTVLSALADEQGGFSAALLFTDEAEIRRLNREFRQIDRVTDVLSFPNAPEEGDPFIGDIAICVPRALEQAGEIGQTPEREIAFLALHGALHLLGYDHETEADEREMLSMQRHVLARAFPGETDV